MAKLKLKKGDKVKVIAGGSKGQEGQILVVSKASNRAIVEGVNMVTKHRKPDPQNPETGGLVEVEAPIQISNLMLLDPTTNEPTRVGRKIVDGKVKRFSKKTGELID